MNFLISEETSRKLKKSMVFQKLKSSNVFATELDLFWKTHVKGIEPFRRQSGSLPPLIPGDF